MFGECTAYTVRTPTRTLYAAECAGLYIIQNIVLYNILSS